MSVRAESDLEAERQQRQAFRTLLRNPLLGGEHPDFSLVRRHHQALRRQFADLLGYELMLRPQHARLRKQPVHVDATRPARVVPGGQEKKATDRWRPFTRRHYAVFALALAALENSGAQTSLSVLAPDILSLAAEEGIPLDFNDPAHGAAHRRIAAEAIGLLVHLGVLRHVDGDAGVWVSGSRKGEEALYDVDHGRLGDLLVARAPADAFSAAQLVEAADAYPPTDEGRRDRLRHRVARRLVEEPVVYLDDLPDDERAYYETSQRPHLERRVAAATGLQVERRAEGTALIDPAPQHGLTDLRFPFNILDRQAALMLCPPLADARRHGQEGLSRGELLGVMRRMVGRLKGREDFTDGESIALLLDDALGVLERMSLITVTDDVVRPRPALARFAAAEVRGPRATATQMPLATDIAL